MTTGSKSSGWDRGLPSRTRARQIEPIRSFADDAPRSEARNGNPGRRQIQSSWRHRAGRVALSAGERQNISGLQSRWPTAMLEPGSTVSRNSPKRLLTLALSCCCTIIGLSGSVTASRGRMWIPGVRSPTGVARYLIWKVGPRWTQAGSGCGVRAMLAVTRSSLAPLTDPHWLRRRAGADNQRI